MKKYHLKLNNLLLNKALSELSVGELYTYIHIVFAIKNGMSSKDSIRYCINDEQLFNSLKDYGYQKSRKTFERHKGTLNRFNFINEGYNSSSFIDVIHRHSSASELKLKDPKNTFTLIDYGDLSLALMTFDQQELKAFIGFKLKDSYLNSKKPIGRLKTKWRLEKKVLNFGDKQTFFRAKKRVLELLRQNTNHADTPQDRLDFHLRQNTNHVKNKSAFKKKNKTVTLVDFKNLKLSYHSLNIINFHRSKLCGLEKLSHKDFQEAINQFDFGLKEGVIKANNPEGLFFYHYKKSKSPILSDQSLSEYHYYQDSGITKSEALEAEIKTKVESKKSDPLESFKSLAPTQEELDSALKTLIEKNSVFKFLAEQPFKTQVRAGFFDHLSIEILKLREETWAAC
ncbi:MAG: hypothetical protein KDD50_07765 [Bdellovibrionales bacterium]|nr:hypothetical protein [Bdellovibrionales bacterium]MCB0414214.1 hypothetical protein [Bdellovibrionales bacterium]